MEYELTQATLRTRLSVLEAQTIVDHDIIAQLEAEGVLDRATISKLTEALVTSRRIGAAIGILMANRKLTEEAALALLRETSQRSHRKLRDVADAVLLTGALDEQPATQAPGIGPA